MVQKLHKLNGKTLSAGISKCLPGHLLEGVHRQPTDLSVFPISVVGIGISFLGSVSKVDLGTSDEGVAEEDKLAGFPNRHLEGSGHALQPVNQVLSPSQRKASPAYLLANGWVEMLFRAFPEQCAQL